MKRYIHLIRHGITEGNQKNMFYGHSDIPLAAEGIDELKSLNEKGVYPKPEAASYYTSELTRAEQTFSLIYGDIPHIRLAHLNEIFFGDYELKTHKDLKKDPGYIAWVNDRSGLSAPHGGESYVQFTERVTAGLRTILDSDAKHSVAVCHGGVICVIMDSCFDDYGENNFDWLPEPGHGYTVTFNDGRPEGYSAF